MQTRSDAKGGGLCALNFQRKLRVSSVPHPVAKLTQTGRQGREMGGRFLFFESSTDKK
jgi:hypothetical protein